MGKAFDLTGKRFGRLVAIERNGSNKRREALWLCRCDCGNEIVVVCNWLTSGHTKSCGCLAKDRLIQYNKSDEKRSRTTELNKVYKRTHGMRYTRLYGEWTAMKNRCRCETWEDYKNYGGRGIRVCDEWLKFEPFRDWALANGYRDDLTLDRIEVDGDYEPQNCRWVTMKEQSNNKRTSHYLEFNGEKKTISEWANELGLNYNTLYSRITTKGWDVERALKTPPFSKRD